MLQNWEINIQPVPFQVGGTLRVDDPTYIRRRADDELSEGLQRGELCYVLTSRQMGKSSLMLQTKRYLSQVGWRCVALDLTSIGTEGITPSQWYKGICAQLWLGFDLGEYKQFQAWWSGQSGNAPQHYLTACLGKIIESYPQQSVVIFIDEIDSVLALNFPIDDFFALIRYTYNQRSVEPEWRRLTFALFGVAKPSDLIRDRNRTPFNIGQAITLEGFSLNEAQPLATKLGLPTDQAQTVLAAILYWTAGQPFLTQKLCRLVWQQLQSHGLPTVAPAAAPAWVNSLVQQQVIHNWEAQDDPEHLRTIRDRILRNEQRAGKLLGLCQKILSQQTSPYCGNEEDTELLLSGLVSRKQGQLQIKNRIYHTLFNADWVAQQLTFLRPYSTLLQQWVASGKGDDSYLLRGKSLTDAQAWQQHKSLSELDYQYLQTSEAAQQKRLQAQLETTQLQVENARLRQEQEVSQLKTRLLLVVSTALAAALGLSFLTWQQYQRAKASEVKALAASSQGLFASHQQLDAMVAAVKAKRGLQQLFRPNGAIQRQVDQVLNQAVFGTNEFNRLTRHDGGVLTVDISPDGNTIVTGSNDKSVRLWGKDGTLLHTLSHQDTVHRVAFSPPGDRIITGSLDGTLQVWSVDGQKLHHLQAHDQPAWGVAVSSDGTLMASASSDRTIKLWRADGTLEATLPVTNTAWSVAFSPDGTELAAAIIDGTIQRWTLQGQPLPTIQAHQAEVWDLAYCGQSNHLVSVSSDRTLKIWDSGGALLHTLQPQEPAALLGVDCSDQHGFIAASDKNNTVSIWQTDGTFVRTLRGHRAVIRDVALNATATMAATASDDGTIGLWQRNSNLLRPLEGHQDTVWSIAVSSDGKTVASLAAGGTLILWQNNVQSATIPLNQRGVTFDATGTTLITSGFSSLKRFRLEQLLQNQPIPLWQQTFDDGATFSVAISLRDSASAHTDGPYIVTGSDSGTIKLWTADGVLKQSFAAHRSRIWQLAISPDGNHLLSASEDGTIKLWTMEGTLLDTPVTQKGAIWGVAFSPDGDSIAATSLDDTLHLWRVSDRNYRQIPGQSQGLTRVAFSPDGQTIATGGVDTTVKLWNRDGTLQNTLPGHSGTVTSLTFSRNGRYLYSGSDDTQLIAWDLEQIATLDPLDYACNWIGNYLKTSEMVAPEDVSLCPEGE